jgi:hypothetical protein
MIAKPHVSARILSTIDEVVRLLEAEVRSHPKEHWKEPCERVGKELSVSVSLPQTQSGPLRMYPPHGNTCLEQALKGGLLIVTKEYEKHRMEGMEWQVMFRFRSWAGRRPEVRAAEGVSPHREHSSADDPPTPSSDPPEPDRTVAEPRAQRAPDPHFRPSGTPSAPAYNEAALIRELERREREHGPNHAGFIVNELLVRFGFEVPEAKRILRGMEMRTIVRTEHKPTPKDPSRMATFVVLNREHPHVRRVLEGAAEITRAFPVATNTGEALSELICRERR